MRVRILLHLPSANFVAAGRLPHPVQLMKQCQCTMREFLQCTQSMHRINKLLHGQLGQGSSWQHAWARAKCVLGNKSESQLLRQLYGAGWLMAIRVNHLRSRGLRALVTWYVHSLQVNRQAALSTHVCELRKALVKARFKEAAHLRREIGK